jgi:hypothetical protein
MKDRLLRKRRALIYLSARVADDRGAVPHPVIPVLAERGGTQLKAPRPTLRTESVRFLSLPGMVRRN